MHVVPLSLREANDFVEAYHRHNGRTSRDGGKFAIGASHEGELVGVAIVGRPIARLLAEPYTCEVLRTCTVATAPKGTGSFLYSACWRVWRAMGGSRLITYTLTTESGSTLRGANWRIVAECKPTTWDRPNRGRRWQSVYGQQKLRWEIAA